MEYPFVWMYNVCVSLSLSIQYIYNIYIYIPWVYSRKGFASRQLMRIGVFCFSPVILLTTNRLKTASFKNPKKNIYIYIYIWAFPKIGIPQNAWFIMENPIKMDDLGVPLFLEAPIYISPASWGNHSTCLRFFFIVWPYKVAQTVQFESYRNINVWWIYLQT